MAKQKIALYGLLVFIMKCHGELQNLCVLVSHDLLPDLSCNEDCSQSKFDVTVGNMDNFDGYNDSVLLLPFNSELKYTVLISYYKELYQSDNEGNCSEVIGIIGGLHSETVRIIHTLARRSTISTTLVAAQASFNFVPVNKWNLPNILDMNPLIYYIQTLISFTDYMNWTRIGLVSDNTYRHHYIAEQTQKYLLEDLGICVVPLLMSTKVTRIARLFR